MTKQQEIEFHQKEIARLKFEIEAEDLRAEIVRLNKALTKEAVGTYISQKGTTWYKFPARMKKDIYARWFFLTDLKGNYIPDKTYYEGHPCKPGWAVKAFYCTTELRAIDCYEREYTGQ